jgi:Nif-specific regulatory protein
VKARAIHVNSARQSRPFVTVDCTTLPSQLVESELFGHERGAFTGADRRVPGKVELAEGGTLFLDELGDLPLDAQGKLLRFLQDRVFERVGGRATLTADVRIVAATHRDLEHEVRRGAFRQDLYYRIRVVEIAIPPLRARGGDEIVELARHFAHVFATRYRRPEPQLDADAVELLRQHDWPGNVRELEHWIESAMALSPDGRVRADALPVPRSRSPESLCPDLPPAASAAVSIPRGLELDDAVRRYVEATIEDCGGNRSEAAKRLGVGRNSITRWLKREG